MTSGKTSAILYYYGHSIEIACNNKFDKERALIIHCDDILPPLTMKSKRPYVKFDRLASPQRICLQAASFLGSSWKEEDCENEITQNAFLWEEGERKGIEKSRRQNYM